MSCLTNRQLRLQSLEIWDYQLIGFGYELGVAIEKLGKRVLAVAHKDSKITRLILGIDHLRFEFCRYEELDDVANLVPIDVFFQQTFDWGNDQIAA